MVEKYILNSNWAASNAAKTHSYGVMSCAGADSSEMELPAKRRAAIYARKSNETEGKSKSVSQQVEHCRQVAKHHGFADEDIIIFQEEEGQKGEFYWDDGAGRFPRPHRPQLGELVRWLRGANDWVYVWRSDRIVRDAGVGDALVQVFIAKGAHLVLGTREIELSSSSGRYQFSSEAANNRRWRDQISEDIQRDHQFKVELGMFSRNPSCLGYRSKGKGSQEVEPVWQEIDLVTRVFRLFCDGLDTATGEQVGPYGTTRIASYLMDEGVRWPKGQKGHKVKHPDEIHETQIRVVLTNCMYVGRWRHKGAEYQCDRLLVPERDERGNAVANGKKVTAIPISLYEAAQQKLAAQQGGVGRRNRSSEHMLTGIAVCARCGRPLQVHYTAYKTQQGEPTRPSRRNFLCKHSRGTRPCPSGSLKRIQEDVLNAWVLRELAPLLALEMQERASASGREASQQALAAAESRLKEAKDKETKKLTALMDVMDAEQLKGVAQALRTERGAIERQISDLQAQVAALANVSIPAFADPDELAGMPTAALKDAIARAVQWIAVGTEGVTVLTSWETYVGARFRAASPEEGETAKVTYIAAVDALSCLDCVEWLADPEEFIRGRRDSLGKQGTKLTDEEILPGLVGQPARLSGKYYQEQAEYKAAA